MITHAAFWFVAGVMSGAAAFLLSLPLYRRLRELQQRRMAGLLVVGAVALIAGAAIVLYTAWGRPDAVGLAAAHSVQPASTPGNAGAAGAESVEAATQKLALRLKSQGGSSADWSLLAQSYDYLGRGTEAAAARARAAGASARAGESASAGESRGAGDSPSADAAGPASATSAAAQQLLAQAEKYRLARDYPRAAEAYRRAADLHAMTADAWANYADAMASESDGRLQGAPADFLQKALRLDPDHPKALWLQASLLHEQHRYAQAQGVWRHLAKVLPPDSPDAAIVASNIAEAQQLAAGPAAVPSDAAPARARVSGEVDIDPKLLAKAAAGMALFVFAKSVDSPGPPLAVVRTHVGSWPVKFSLDDSQAMLPQRSLSKFQSVIVEARISGGGQPLAQRGDLQGTSGEIDSRSGKPIRVVIRDVIEQ
jgi:cytochrome c-type biogenesis protein CcmH